MGCFPAYSGVKESVGAVFGFSAACVVVSVALLPDVVDVHS